MVTRRSPTGLLRWGFVVRLVETDRGLCWGSIVLRLTALEYVEE
jgi:hypothetical protein